MQATSVINPVVNQVPPAVTQGQVDLNAGAQGIGNTASSIDPAGNNGGNQPPVDPIATKGFCSFFTDCFNGAVDLIKSVATKFLSLISSVLCFCFNRTSAPQQTDLELARAFMTAINAPGQDVAEVENNYWAAYNALPDPVKAIVVEVFRDANKLQDDQGADIVPTSAAGLAVIEAAGRENENDEVTDAINQWIVGQEALLANQAAAQQAQQNP
jgi:hypothetical protein